MRRAILLAILGIALAPLAVRAQQDPPPADETVRLRQEVDQLKKTLANLEERLATQEQKDAAKSGSAAPAAAPSGALEATVKQLDQRVTRTERNEALQRIRFSGDYRFEAHSIRATIPTHFDGMMLQNLIVKSLFYVQTNGGQFPPSVDAIRNNVAAHLADYNAFSGALTFSDLKNALGQFPPAAQQQLLGLLLPATFTRGYDYNNSILYTNRLRLNLDSQLSDNLSFTGRLSMYKVFGDSTGVQVFNGQPTSLNIDGTTAGVPNSDILRVERAYFTWSKIGGSPAYLSIGRRPSTQGPPLEYRNDELRGGTPLGTLIDFQFDGITIGYHIGEKTTLRACYGLGFESGFGNADNLKTPGQRLSDVHFIGGNLDLWSTDKTLIQATVARAFDVTDGFNGLVVFPVNPITGDPVPAAVMRFTPSGNLGNIDLAGFVATRRQGKFNLFASANWSGLRPYNVTGPFGGLGADPFDTPTNHDGYMVYFGGRYNMGKDDATKVGVEYNHGSKYWFNFANAEDDIIAPKTSARGNVYEAYLTHRIYKRFILKFDYIHYDYQWSGSGWHVGAPKKLNASPILGFPTYDQADKLMLGFMTRF